MSVFKDYSAFYDLLYEDKDYGEETQFIAKLLQRHAPDAASILDIGCGTGKHASLLAEQGYAVHGLDISAEMIALAMERQKCLRPSVSRNLNFSQGDVKSFNLQQRFDVVVSLFHVMSYQATISDFEAALSSVSKHLQPGGLFVFDYWYGPAVLADLPKPRMKELENAQFKIRRSASPDHFPRENRVDVRYKLFVTNKISGETRKISETHRMRYLFLHEIEGALSRAGLSALDSRGWLTDLEPDVHTWGVYTTARKEE